MDMIREDAQMYMSPGEMMALFNDGSVDVGNLFSQDSFMQPNPNDHSNGAGGGFMSPSYLKMNGMVSSP